MFGVILILLREINMDLLVEFLDRIFFNGEVQIGVRQELLLINGMLSPMSILMLIIVI